MIKIILPNHVCMSVGQVQNLHISVCSGTSRQYGQWEIDEIFKGLPNIFCIADDILIVSYDVDDRDHDKALSQVMQICWQKELKLNKNVISGAPEYHF